MTTTQTGLTCTAFKEPLWLIFLHLIPTAQAILIIIFSVPFSEDEARLVILPVPWEVTVSFGSGTARAAEQIMRASLQVDLFDPDVPEGWKEGFYLKRN